MNKTYLPVHFMVAECDGHLYDTRRVDWTRNPIRHNYARVTAPGTIGIRAAIRQAYAWPGGYDLFGITSDGACLCIECMRSNYRAISDSVRKGISDGWKVEGIESTVNIDGPLCCDHCNKELIEGAKDD